MKKSSIYLNNININNRLNLKLLKKSSALVTEICSCQYSYHLILKNQKQFAYKSTKYLGWLNCSKDTFSTYNSMRTDKLYQHY